MEQSRTTASLRGIHAVGGGVAWASGTSGTVLRTEDAGFVWQSCAMPPGAEKLDFRGVWAWDAMTAIVMSSGPGDQSRLYKTTDGCVNWKLLLTNPDKEGFWDGIAFSDSRNGYLLGDPVDGRIVLLRTGDGGLHWTEVISAGLSVGAASTGFFAASNSSMVLTAPVMADTAVGDIGLPWLGTGSAKAVDDGKWHGPFVLEGDFDCAVSAAPRQCLQKFRFTKQNVPLAGGANEAGVFSLALQYSHGRLREVMAVGGNYKDPNGVAGTSAWSLRGGKWTLSLKPPHGFRSAVAYDPQTGAWVCAGPNGSDFSRDDGRTWQPLDNGNWNAISLPWFVGPNGRIGKLVSLPTASQKPQ